MKLCFFDSDRLGLVEENVVYDVSHALEALPAHTYPFPRQDEFIAALPALRRVIGSLKAKAQILSLDEIHLKSPVLNPGKIVAAPVNYKKHLEEAIADEATFSRAHVRVIQETGLFLKATSSLIGTSEYIRLPLPERRTDHEIELAAIIGRPAFRVARAEALDYIAGYCIGLDITIRGPEERSLRKSLDTYTVLGPWLVTADEFGDPAGAAFDLHVNGELRQQANTSDLIMDVAELIAFVSRYYTLQPGDVLLTGTPEGVGQIQPGDEVVSRFDRIGEMRTRVTAL